jgi:hypothetical protein
VAGRRDEERPQPARLEVGLHHLGELTGLGHVDLVEHHEARAVGKAAVGLQLRLDHVEVGERVAARLERGAVEDVDERGTALDVTEELQPQALALTGTGMRPGTSATVKRTPSASTTPRFGTRVVKG